MQQRRRITQTAPRWMTPSRRALKPCLSLVFSLPSVAETLPSDVGLQKLAAFTGASVKACRAAHAQAGGDLGRTVTLLLDPPTAAAAVAQVRHHCLSLCSRRLPHGLSPRFCCRQAHGQANGQARPPARAAGPPPGQPRDPRDMSAPQSDPSKPAQPRPPVQAPVHSDGCPSSCPPLKPPLLIHLSTLFFKKRARVNCAPLRLQFGKPVPLRSPLSPPPPSHLSSSLSPSLLPLILPSTPIPDTSR